jgi:hypothetical protein
MQKIPLELAAAGMKLAKPVKNERGMILCGAGTELTEATVGRLSDMGVRRITVQGHPVDTGEQEKPLADEIAELNARFRLVEGDALMSKIKNIFSKRLQGRAEEE